MTFVSGAGPAFYMGDPLLNKNVAMEHRRPCEDRNDCWTPEDVKYLKWRSLKQVLLSVDCIKA